MTDLVITGARIWTGASALESGPQRAALAVKGDRIVAIGSDASVLEQAGGSSAGGSSAGAGAHLDLPGALIVPGFQDAHVHPMFAGRFLGGLTLHALSTVEAYLAVIGAYAAAHPELPWIFGAGWEAWAFGPGSAELDRELLDRVVPDRPVFLYNASLHEAWVNTRALEVAGLGSLSDLADVVDPVDGRFGRRSAARDGDQLTLNGHLVEGAAYRFEEEHVPAPGPDERQAGILAGQRHLHELGITGWQDAWVTPETLDAYVALASSGALTGRVRAALWWRRDRGLEQIADLVEQRARIEALGLPSLSAGTVKIMVDGVVENFSAGMLAPYHLQCDRPTSGLIYVSPGVLREALISLDRLGFQVHLHTIGDRAVRIALDAVEAALEANGPRGNRHQLAHIQVIDPADVPRFGALGVVANCQAYWAQSDAPMEVLTVPFLGAERVSLQYPFASLAAHGATLAMGSDWPVSTADPLAQISVAVRRSDPALREAVSFLPSERIGLETALRAFTAGSAYANHDVDGGQLAVGLRADLTILDRDPFAEMHSAADRFDTGIADARVLHTVASGRIVYSRSG